VNAELSKQVGIEHHVRAVYHPDVKTFDEKEAKELKGFVSLVTLQRLVLISCAFQSIMFFFLSG